jgi:hypothetical protein
VKEIRKKIRNRTFKSKANLKLYLEEIKKWKRHKEKEEMKEKQIIWKE